MSKIFNLAPAPNLKHNKFDLSHEKKLSGKLGKLIPIFMEEVVPGDKFRVSSEIMIRLAPMLAPIMHRMDVFTHYFFVPNRLIWDEWETFITGGQDGLQEPVFPYMQLNDILLQGYDYCDAGSLADYLGIPVLPDDYSGNISGDPHINALPFRAYQLIYDEYYRDEKLSTEIAASKLSGEVTDYAKLLQLRVRAWERDYFTSASPEQQLGAEVGIPADFNYKEKTLLFEDDTLSVPASAGTLQSTSAGGGNYGITGTNMAGHTVVIDNLENDSINITVNELRRSIKLQQWLERNARAGWRYIEQILSHFGVKSDDSRLQRPEYLGGGKSPVIISEVTNNTSISTEEPLGTLAGHGISIGKTNSFSHYFNEHGYIIGIMSIIPKPVYHQGLPKIFTKFDKFDYYWPEFANLGEQEILSKELFWNPLDPEATNDAVFGYQSRYCEYKFKQNTVHGDFHNTLDFWHMGRDFSARPSLNQTFIECDPTDRIFAVTDPDVDKFYCQIYNRVDALRLMPYYNIPSI